MGRRLWQILYQLWAFGSIIVVFSVLITPPTLLVIPFPVKWRLKMVGPFWRVFGLYTLKIGCLAKVLTHDRREASYRVGTPRGLYIANHQSFLDIPLALTLFRVPPVMKKEVLYIPLIGLMGWVMGALPVTRGKRHSRKKVFVQARDRLVREQLAVQYYPEGTRSKNGQPKGYDSLKVTLIHLAWEAKIPVFPVSLYGTHQVISDQGVIATGKRLGIIAHPLVDPGLYPTASTFARACWEQVLKGHAELQASLES